MMTKLAEKEHLLNQCEADLLRIQAIRDELRVIEANRKALEVYYTQEYAADYDNLQDTNQHFRVLDQDSIWNVLDDQYREKIGLVKDIVRSI
ncbi:hypothetical protein VH441_02600 [Psychrobacter sp. HD31]|uniref:hypothetical protein n=1 Tax=Psychrobacter sp. HD31 TaxID=3112003 RepID=UPI003DA5C3D1